MVNRSTEAVAARCAVFACSTALERNARGEQPADGLTRMLCAGGASAGAFLRAVESGAARVRVIACADDACRHHNGARVAQDQVRLARRLLDVLGYDRDTITLELVDRSGECRPFEPEAGD